MHSLASLTPAPLALSGDGPVDENAHTFGNGAMTSWTDLPPYQSKWKERVLRSSGAMDAAEVVELAGCIRPKRQSDGERGIPCNRPSLNRVRGTVASQGLSRRYPLALSLLEFWLFSSPSNGNSASEARAKLGEGSSGGPALRKVLSLCAWTPLTSYSFLVDVEADGPVLPTFDAFHKLVYSAAGVGAWCDIVTARLPNSDVSHAVSVLARAAPLNLPQPRQRSWAFARCGQSGADERDLFASIRARTIDVQSFAAWDVFSACWRSVPGHASLHSFPEHDEA